MRETASLDPVGSASTISHRILMLIEIGIMLFVLFSCSISLQASTIAVLPPVDMANGSSINLTELHDRVLAEMPAWPRVLSRRSVESALRAMDGRRDSYSNGLDEDAMAWLAQYTKADYLLLIRVYSIEEYQTPSEVYVRTAWAENRCNFAPGYPMSSDPRVRRGSWGNGIVVNGQPSFYSQNQAGSAQLRHPVLPNFAQVEYMVTRAERTIQTRIALVLIKVFGFNETAAGFIEPQIQAHLEYADYDGNPSSLVADIQMPVNTTYSGGDGVGGFIKRVVGRTPIPMILDNNGFTPRRSPIIEPLDTNIFHAPREFNEAELERQLIREAAQQIGEWFAGAFSGTSFNSR